MYVSGVSLFTLFTTDYMFFKHAYFSHIAYSDRKCGAQESERVLHIKLEVEVEVKVHVTSLKRKKVICYQLFDAIKIR